MNIKPKLKQQLMRHEGVRYKPYRCSADKLTIGVGRNLEDNGLSEDEVQLLLDNDIKDVLRTCATLPYWKDLNEARRLVRADMMFNLGYKRFKGFKKMEAALREGRWEKAAVEMLDSKWARQVGQRSNTLAVMMKRGI